MWLHVDNHWLNMAHALVVDDDETSHPPVVTVRFPGGLTRDVARAERLKILEWLEQESRAPGVYGNAPFLSYDSRSA